MRQIFLIILTACLITGLNSCCTKKDCHSVEGIYEIEFHNFNQQDLDTITIYSFSKNTNFATPIDSLTTQGQQSGNTFNAYIDKIEIDLDYKIILNSTGQLFTLTDFETERVGCNGCFPYRPKSDYYNRLKTYKVNGQTQSGQRIEIHN